VNETVDLQVTMQLISKQSGAPFNITSDSDPKVAAGEQDMKILVDFSSSKKNMSVSAVIDFYDGDSVDWAFLGASSSICILLSLSVCYGGFKVEMGALDHFDRAAQGYLSAVVLSVVYFQYFGIFVMFLLIVDSSYFIFYVVASISLVVMACQSYKIAFIFFLERNLADPNLRAPGLRSPRGKFVCFTLVFLITNYLASSLLIRYVQYAHYIVGLSIFPLLNILENAFRGAKKCYSR
jgi:hypothetical protein